MSSSTATKKSRSSSSSTNNTSSIRLTLVKTINALATKQEALIKAVENLKDFTTDTLQDLDMQIESKRADLEDLEKQYKVREVDLTIELNQSLKMKEYDAAKDLLSKRGEIPVSKETYESLQTSLETLQKKDTSELDKLRDELRASYKKELNAALSNCELRHKAEIAESSAAIKQRDNQIATLQETISNLRSEIASQRELTRSVAESSKQGAIQQSFGGK